MSRHAGPSARVCRAVALLAAGFLSPFFGSAARASVISPVQVIGSNVLGRAEADRGRARPCSGDEVDQAERRTSSPVAKLVGQRRAGARLERAGERRRLDQRVAAVDDVERDRGARRGRSSPTFVDRRRARSRASASSVAVVELPAGEGSLNVAFSSRVDRDVERADLRPGAARRRRSRVAERQLGARVGQLDAVGDRQVAARPADADGSGRRLGSPSAAAAGRRRRRRSRSSDERDGERARPSSARHGRAASARGHSCSVRQRVSSRRGARRSRT